jgi:hypothetical protein
MSVTAVDEHLMQRAGVEMRPLPQGALLVDMNTGRCFRLNQVGAEIWALLSIPRPLTEVLDKVASNHALPPEQIESDVKTMVDQLVVDRLIDVAVPGSR